MGEIIENKFTKNKKVKCKISLDIKEFENLKGHMKNIHFFSEKLCLHESKVNNRGNNGVTKYFKVPLKIRSRKKFERELNYKKIETPTKTFYIYILKKEKLKTNS